MKLTERQKAVVAGGVFLFALAALSTIHIVFGGMGGVHLCWKYGWSLSDTLVDLDEQYPSAKVAEALHRCHI